MKHFKTIIQLVLLFFATNVAAIQFLPQYSNFLFVVSIIAALIIFIVINIVPVKFDRNVPNRLYLLNSGIRLLELSFLLNILNTVFNVFLLLYVLAPNDYDPIKPFIANIVVWLITSFIITINILIRLYLSSKQMGIQLKIAYLLLWWFPVVNLLLLFKMYSSAKKEYDFEIEKIQLDRGRRYSQICTTKYPILFVHGVFFRDSNFFNYWGRIPDELTANGAIVYYGEQQSAASIVDSAKELAEQIKKIINETGHKKFNIIAHSKGGLDTRYMIAKCGMEDSVATLTTMNTPHRGCEFAEYLLGQMPEKVVNQLASTYNSALLKFGDHAPDFISAVTDLKKSRCEDFNKEIFNSDKVYYQSVGSALVNTHGGRFPLNLSSKFVKLFDGENDGLVSLSSMEWGERFRPINSDKKRGISHADIIDLYRENINNFDVREFYVNLVVDLKQKGF